jgi:hypothetical protein
MIGGQISHTISDSLGDNARSQAAWRVSRVMGTFLLVALPALFVGGCSEPRVPVFPVMGKVTFQGKPPVGARVVLHAANPQEIDDVAPSGDVQGDGSFAITVYEPGDGAPQGEYVATVQWFKMVSGAGGSGAGPNVLPKKYGSPVTSPIKVSVAGGPVQIPPIDLK